MIGNRLQWFLPGLDTPEGSSPNVDPDCATCQLIDEFALLSTSQPGDKETT